MLNDNTTPTQTTQTTQPETPPLPIRDYAFLGGMIRALTEHIERVVDARFAALVESHKTLALMDENMRNFITEMIDERITEHESDKAHPSDGDVENEVNEGIDRYMRHGNHDFITERNLSEKVSDVLDEILDDRIENALDKATVSISL